MTLAYDAIIIGTGQAGPSLAGRLTAAGMRVAVIERGLFGGTCVNTGCIPTKTMVASAYAAHMARRAAEFGVTITGPVRVDMKRVKARKDQISGQSNQGVETWLKNMANCTVYQGHARFESPIESQRRRRAAYRRPDLHQRGRPRRGAGHPRAARGPLSHQQLHDGTGFPSAASDHRGRQLHRPGIRPDVPALRQRGHNSRSAGRA